MKKVFLSVSLVLFCMAAVFAGGSKQQSTGGKTTLTVWDFKYAEEVTGKAFREMDALFMQENPDIIINHAAQAESTFYDLLLQTFSAKGNVDVVISHPGERSWAFTDFLEVLDPYITAERSQYSKLALEACSPTRNPDRDTLMLPLTAQGIGIYYNKANFRKAGLDPDKAPAAWNDFLAACEALKNANIPPVIMGNVTTATSVNWLYRTLLVKLYGDRSAGFLTGSANFTDPEYRQATTMIKELFTRGYVNADNASLSLFMDAIDLFKSGQGGFFIGLNSDIAHWKDFGESLGYNNVGYFPGPIPQGSAFPDAQVNQGAGLGMSVMNYRPNKDAAVKYIKFYTSGKGAKIFLDASGAIVPNTTVPMDTGNNLLSTVLNEMNVHGGLDYSGFIPAGMSADYDSLNYLFFVSGEISIDSYIRQLQDLIQSYR
ncbi:MAG: extracellular solute-binding protein [Treponema sp.]|nr:extracellular solute-binding protein [Treponema sp.]